MELKELSKDELLTLLDAYARHTLATDGYWFMAVEDKFGYNTAMELDAKVWEKLAEAEGNRMLRALKLKERNVAAMLHALEISPVALTLGPKIKVESPHRGLVWFEDCRIQKNRMKLERECFICKPMGFVWIEGFARAFDPAIKVECVFCHPDPHPEGEWCKWLVSSPNGMASV